MKVRVFWRNCFCGKVTQDYPILFTFRRCPYAIRARLALALADIVYESIEVDLKNKPAQLLLHSPKGTVPVLVMKDGRVLEQSLEIMYWALQQSDDLNTLPNESAHLELTSQLIAQNDGEFKRAIDCYKYPERYSADILVHWNTLLIATPFFCGTSASLADYALMPFVRQFAAVNHVYFEALAILNIHRWLINLSQSAVFQKVMAKP
jgi:glutathione S-transferase